MVLEVGEMWESHWLKCRRVGWGRTQRNEAGLGNFETLTF